eukprot:6173475-Pleurochrysis_carterae.AAC.1
MSFSLVRGRLMMLLSFVGLVIHVWKFGIPLVETTLSVIFVKSVVLLYRLDSAAPPNNRRGGARPTMIMRLE